MNHLMNAKVKRLSTILFIIILIITVCNSQQCPPCYAVNLDTSCPPSQDSHQYHVLHMSVHPHLDAFWIYNFQKYYDPLQVQNKVEMTENYFSSVRSIFDTITEVLDTSRKFREIGDISQQAHRSFFNSQMGFFKRWYSEQEPQKKEKIKRLLKTKYWEILGGGYVQHDEGCAYYEDIIQNFDMGLQFLRSQFEYYPKVAISADSFGHSQSTLAILAHLGIQGFFVQRSDEHILLQNKTQFMWRAKSTNNMTYGVLPTHIRWAIHGYQNQFDRTSEREELCYTKQTFFDNMRNENDFLKRILNSNHIMRYFGHDFQKFDDYSYRVLEATMEKFATEKCNRVVAVYGNPTEYFTTLLNEVWNQAKPLTFRNSDIFPIWDYDSGLYWTGYYTTDPYHKKIYRDSSRFLHAVRKAFMPYYIEKPNNKFITHSYELLEQYAQLIVYLQHHDGVSGTSKYVIMDEYEAKCEKLSNKIKQEILTPIFNEHFSIDESTEVFNCGIFNECVIPGEVKGNILIKIFNSGGSLANNLPIKISMPENKFYKPVDCQYETVCVAHSLPCSCNLYLYPKLFTYKSIKLQQVSQPQKAVFLQDFTVSQQYKYNKTHFIMQIEGEEYGIGYKTIKAVTTQRRYEHLSRYGKMYDRGFSITSGKYALGNDPKFQADYSHIRKVYTIKTKKLTQFFVLWAREQMKTVITINNGFPSEWKVETLQSAQNEDLRDIYLEIFSTIKNSNKFYTDSNGWLVMERELYKREDFEAFFSPEGFDNINGNSYPMTAFAYIKDEKRKLSVNCDRPEGVIGLKEGKIWINIDRLSGDDGKWVYETTYRNQYQKFTHLISVGSPSEYPERKLQLNYDQPLIISGAQVEPNEKIETYFDSPEMREKWVSISHIDEVKFWIRARNNSEVTVRIMNPNDHKNVSVGIFAGHSSPFLTSYYGRLTNFQQIKQMSLGANMDYETFLRRKWKTKFDLSEENKIFEKEFKQTIELRPLEIRTFNFRNVSFSSKCIEAKDLAYSGNTNSYTLNLMQVYPQRQNPTLENNIIKYFLQADHCNNENPVLYRNALNDLLLKFKTENPEVYPMHHSVPLPKQIQDQVYPKQKLPQDIKPNNSFYPKLAEVEKKPITLKMLRKIKIQQLVDENDNHNQLQTKDQSQSSNTINQEQNIPIKKAPHQTSSLPSLPNDNQEVSLPETNESPVISAIKQKIQLNFMLTKSEKEEYFRWKLQKIKVK